METGTEILPCMRRCSGGWNLKKGGQMDLYFKVEGESNPVKIYRSNHNHSD